METNFFSQIQTMLEGLDLQMTIKKKDEKLTLAVFSTPRIDDSAKKHIRPLSFVGTPEELDQNFFSEIKKPMELVSSWSLGMKKFEEGMAQAEAKSQRAKKKEEADRKKTSEVQNLLNKAEPLLKDNKPRQAIPHIEKALKVLPDHVAANKLLKEAQAKAGLGPGLFPVPEPSQLDQPQTENQPDLQLNESKS